jgi:hypothetical protein
MELKIVCQCGQKYKFDVEPVGGRMPFTVNCPVCQADGTMTANMRLAEHFRFVPPPPQANAPPQVVPNPVVPPPPPPPPIAPSVGGLRINRAHAEPAPAPVAAIAPAESAADAPPAIGSKRPFAVAQAAKPEKKTSFGMGLLGGLIGTVVGVLIYFVLFKYTDLHYKILAVGVGGLAGWLAELFGKGEGSKELGGITAVLVVAGIIGAQYVVALGWWHDVQQEDLKLAQSAYTESVAEANNVMQAVPTGSDAEIRAYLVKEAAKDGDKVSPGSIADDDVKSFRELQLPEYKDLASGKITKEQYEEKNGLKTSLTKEEQQSDEGTFKAVFLLLLLSKTNLFSLAAAAGLAFKLSTNA